MKIVFFGTSQFAVPSLKKLVDTHEVVMVVTQPDRKKGRRLQLGLSPVKIEAQKLNLPIHQPEDASDKNSVELLKKQKADLFVVISFGQILKKEVLQIPKFYAINVHGSLLPKYRGAGPVNWAIMKGETTTGISVIRMSESMDAGDIMLKKELKISADDTAFTLNEKLSEFGSELLLDVVGLIEDGKGELVKQNEEVVSYAPKLKKNDGLIDWGRGASELHNFVKGLVPWPCAFTRWKGKIVKIWKSDVDKRTFKFKPGQIAAIENEGIIVQTGNLALIIKELQIEGGKKMDAGSFLRGHKLKTSDKLG